MLPEVALPDSAQAPRFHSRGFFLPSLSQAPVAPAKAVEIGATVEVPEMPAGYHLEDKGGVLQLVRERDGERLGIMSSPGLAARHAAALVRLEAARA